MSFYQRFYQSVQFCHTIKHTFLRTSMPCNVWSSKTTACWVSLHLKYNNFSPTAFTTLRGLPKTKRCKKRKPTKNWSQIYHLFQILGLWALV